MQRRIIHYDMDAFYASVEQHDRPELRGQPIIVGGNGRGVVMTASYEARRYGIRSAMPTSQAMRLCPGLIRVDGRMARYKEVSRQVRDLCRQFTELIEPLSLDEGFLDVTQWCDETGEKAGLVARELKRRIRAETGLTASAGVGPNKLVAKIGSDLRKPDGLVIIPPHGVVDFLRPLPIERIWGVGPVTAVRLRQLGLETMGQLADRSPDWVEQTLGRVGLHYQKLAQGLDDRPVVPSRAPRSVSSETTFERDITLPAEAERVLAELADELARRVRHHQYRGLTLTLKVRYTDFSTVSRSYTGPGPLQAAAEILRLAQGLLLKTEFPARFIRLLGIGLSNLVHDSEPRQMELCLTSGFL